MKRLFLIIFYLHICLINWQSLASSSSSSAAAQTIIKKAHSMDLNNLRNALTLPTFTRGKIEVKTAHEYQKIAQSFGNKTANLCLLDSLCSKIHKSLELYTVQVPAFTGISNEQLTLYLNATIGLGKLWAQFIQIHKNSKSLSEESLLILDGIQKKIAGAFANTKSIPEDIATGLETFLKHNTQSLLMVRSTGLEDRIDMANAGGNESIAAVQPTLSAVWQSIGQVIASYFSQKSLTQRLLAGDTLTQDFFIPVLIQTMIGEPAWKGKDPKLADIPISGVIFTQEVEGNTPGITQIQSAYGHNQGVVNGLVAVDTYYVGNLGIVHPIIRQKKQRLVTESSTLIIVPNSLKLQNASSLEPLAVTALKKVSDAVHLLYDYPTDIEYVVKDKVIYLVQARPLVSKKQAMPNYVDNDFLVKNAQANKIKGITLVSAGGFVRAITQPDQVLTANTLAQALNVYHADSSRDKVLAVFIDQMAPATSHEATQFRGYNIPILVCNTAGIKKIKEQLNGKNTLLFDPQQAILLDTNQMSEKEITAIIKPGWYVHPLPMQASIIKDFLQPAHKEYALLYEKYMRELKPQKNAPDDRKQSLRELTKALVLAPDRPTLVKLSKTILNRIQKSLGRLAVVLKWSNLTIEAQETLQLIQYIKLCLVELLQASEGKSKDTIKQLYSIRFLQAAIFQQHDGQIINDFSYVQFLKMHRQDLLSNKELRTKKQQSSIIGFDYALQLNKISKFALNEDTEKAWRSFINGITASVDPKKNVHSQIILRQFSNTIAKLQELGVLDIWINTIFLQAWSNAKSSDSFSLMQQLNDSVSKNESIQWISNQENILKIWQNKSAQWADPKNFPTLWKEFNHSFIEAFISGSTPESIKAFNELYNEKNITSFDHKKLTEYTRNHGPLVKLFLSADPLAKIMLLSFFKKLIDTYDATIKSLTGSPEYKDKQLQVNRFWQLLIPYFALMEQMTVLIQRHEKKLFSEEWHEKWTFNNYLTLIHSDSISQNILRFLNESQLKLSQGFNVSAAQIGSKANFLDTTPKTLEDLFTLAHQNMLVTISILNTDYGLSKETFPHFIRKIADMIEEMSISNKDSNNTPHLVGVDYQYPMLRIYYNLALQAHSNVFEISYNSNKPNQAILACKFLGQDDNMRMLGIQAYIELTSRMYKIPFVIKPHNTVLDNNTSRLETAGFGAIQQTSFSWLISNNTSLDILKKLLTFFIKETFNFKPIPDLMLSKINALCYDKVTNEKQSASNSKEKMQELDIFKQYPELTDDFFSNDLFLNSWAIDSCIRNNLYEKALQLCKITLNQIIKKNVLNFPDVFSPVLDDYTHKSLLSYCMDILITLLKVNSTKDQAYQLLSKAITDNLNVTNKDTVSTFLKTACILFDHTKSSQSAKILEDVLSNRVTPKVIYDNYDNYFKPCLDALDKIDPTGKRKNEIYKKIDILRVEKAFAYIKEGNYRQASWIADDLFNKAPQDPDYYHYVANIAQELCKATKIYSELYYGRKKELHGTNVQLPGYQYQQVSDIAKRLIKFKQKELAHEVLTCLQEQEKTLAQQALQSKNDATALKNLQEAITAIADKLKKE